MTILPLTPFEKKIYSSHKPYILAKGTRRCGKSFIGSIWVAMKAYTEKCTVWVMAPDIKRLQFIFEDIRRFTCKANISLIKSINKQRYFEIILEPYDSRIYFITDQDLFGVFPKGRIPPDFIYMDDVDCYSKAELRRIHRQLRKEIGSRGGNPNILITYSLVRQHDRLQALWTVAKNKDTWECISSYEKGDKR